MELSLIEAKGTTRETASRREGENWEGRNNRGKMRGKEETYCDEGHREDDKNGNAIKSRGTTAGCAILREQKRSRGGRERKTMFRGTRLMHGEGNGHRVWGRRAAQRGGVGGRLTQRNTG